MKNRILSRLGNKRGFSLVECVMAIAVFAVMSAMALAILANALHRKSENNTFQVDMNEQLEQIANGAIDQNPESTGVAWVPKIESGEVIGDYNKDGTSEINYKSYHKSDAEYHVNQPEFDLSKYEAGLLSAVLDGTNSVVIKDFTVAKINVKSFTATPLPQNKEVNSVTYTHLHEYQLEVEFQRPANLAVGLIAFQMPSGAILYAIDSDDNPSGAPETKGRKVSSTSGSGEDYIRALPDPTVATGTSVITITFLAQNNTQFTGFWTSGHTPI